MWGAFQTEILNPEILNPAWSGAGRAPGSDSCASSAPARGRPGNGVAGRTGNPEMMASCRADLGPARVFGGLLGGIWDSARSSMAPIRGALPRRVVLPTRAERRCLVTIGLALFVGFKGLRVGF